METLLLQSIANDMRAGRDYKSKLIQLMHFFYSSQSDVEKMETDKYLSNFGISQNTVAADELLKHLSNTLVPQWMEYFQGINMEMVQILTDLLVKITAYQETVSGHLITTTPQIDSLLDTTENDLTNRYVDYLFKLEEFKFKIHQVNMSGLLRPSNTHGLIILKNLLTILESYFNRNQIPEFVPKDQRPIKDVSEYALKRMIHYIVKERLHIVLPLLPRKFFTYFQSEYNQNYHQVYNALRMYAKVGYSGASLDEFVKISPDLEQQQ